MPLKIDIFGVGIDALTQDAVLARIRAALAARQRLLVTHVHVKGLNIAYRTPWLVDFFNSAGVVYCDGSGVRLGSFLLGSPLPARFTLADWMGDLMRIVIKCNARVFLLGNPPGVAEKAARKLAEIHPGLRVAGAHHGYFDRSPGSAENDRIVSQINAGGADLLLVGMGMPLQEAWIRDNQADLQPSVLMTVGGVFEYFSGDLTRAPRWVTQNGLEWLALTLQSPGRYWKRYLIGNPLFVYRLLKERISPRYET